MTENGSIPDQMMAGINRLSVLFALFMGIWMEIVAIFRLVPFDSASGWLAMVLVGGLVGAGLGYICSLTFLWGAIAIINWLGQDSALRRFPGPLQRLFRSLEPER